MLACACLLSASNSSSRSPYPAAWRAARSRCRGTRRRGTDLERSAGSATSTRRIHHSSPSTSRRNAIVADAFAATARRRARRRRRWAAPPSARPSRAAPRRGCRRAAPAALTALAPLPYRYAFRGARRRRVRQRAAHNFHVKALVAPAALAVAQRREELGRRLGVRAHQRPARSAAPSPPPLGLAHRRPARMVHAVGRRGGTAEEVARQEGVDRLALVAPAVDEEVRAPSSGRRRLGDSGRRGARRLPAAPRLAA